MSANEPWPSVRLGGHASVKARIGWKGLQASEYREKGCIFLATPNIKGPRIDFRNVNFISERRYIESPELMLHPGDVLLVKDGSTLGISNIVRYLPGPATVNGSIAVLRCSERLHPGFLHQLTKADAFQKLVSDKKSGLGVPHLFQADLREFEIPLPILPEQRRIAEILDTLDEAIRKTEQVIAKLQQMKQGLLHDLLTRGIDDNGELRDPDRHPEQFKDSPLGRVPKTWEIRPVEKLLAGVDPAMRSGPFGSALLKNELVSTGVPLLGIDNVHVERFVAEYTRFVTPQKAIELSRYYVRPRDVMITIMGTVGRCALVPDDIGTALSSKHVWTLTFDQNEYSPYLACLQFNHAPWVLRHFGRDVQGGIMSAIRSETLRTALLPVPPRQEQTTMEAIVRDLDSRVIGEQRDADKLRTLKQGLMDDLLTGRVRVRVAEDTAG